MRHFIYATLSCLIFFCAALFGTRANAEGLSSGDLSRLRSIGSVAISPDARYIAYTITMRDQPGRPSGQLWVMDLSAQKSVRLGGDKPASAPLWSADSKWVAFHGSDGDKSSLLIAHPDGSGATALAPLAGSNSPLPDTGKEIAWSPDSKQIAFISSTPDDRAAEASGDPMVITRYLYKPDYGEGLSRFNDNQRLHIFAVDIGSKKIRQLTQEITTNIPSIGHPMESNSSSLPIVNQIRTNSLTMTYSPYNSPITASIA